MSLKIDTPEEIKNIEAEHAHRHSNHSPSTIAGAVDNLINAPKLPLSEPPTINLKAKIILPAMPKTLTVAGIKPASLDDAYASGGNFVVDVGTLDEADIEQVIQRWGIEFRQHAKELRKRLIKD